MLMSVRRLAGAVGLVLLIALFSAPAGLAQVVTGWQTETVDAEGDVGSSNSLALDSVGRPHISYIRVNNTYTNSVLEYASFDGDEWQIETVDSEDWSGGGNSLVLDSAGHPHISYVQGPVANNLKYAVFDGTSWQIGTVDVGDFGSDTSLALDSDGHPHIAYINDIQASNDTLKYAKFNGTSWQIETVAALGNQGTRISLALDGDGLPHISYFFKANRSIGNLWYARFDGVTWQTVLVDLVGPDADYPSLALDNEGQPHISYHDNSNGNLKYAHYDGSGWQIKAVDTAEDVGRDTSLALDSIDQPHISYFDETNDDLKYASFDGADWQFQTVDTTGNVGWETSLALDASDQPHISYYDATNGDLKYAHTLLNHRPTVDPGGPYSGDEGAAVSLNGAVNDPESDTLTTEWSYDINDADPGTSCSFGDASQLETTFTCTDDGTFTLTLTADEGLNPAVTATAPVTIANSAPTISETRATLAGTQLPITVDASDPGENDVLGYAFDCDADGAYEVDAGAISTMVCSLNPQQEGVFTFGIQVSDDDGGVSTDSVTVTIATDLCASDYTGLLRYSDSCHDYETAVVIAGEATVRVCASIHNGLLRAPLNGTCAGHETLYLLPGQGPLHVCVNRHTQTLRLVGDVGQCSSNEFGRVIGATEIGGTTTRTR